MKRKTCPECGASFGGGEPKIGATGSDKEIRRLYQKGLSVEAIAERMNMPTTVIAEWVQREVRESEPSEPPEESEADEAEFSQEAADGIGEHWSDAAVYRCSDCKETVAQANADSHECAETDWSDFG